VKGASAQYRNLHIGLNLGSGPGREETKDRRERTFFKLTLGMFQSADKETTFGLEEEEGDGGKESG